MPKRHSARYAGAPPQAGPMWLRRQNRSELGLHDHVRGRMYFQKATRFKKKSSGGYNKQELMTVAVEKREREEKRIAALLTQDRSGFWTFFYKRTCLALISTLLGLLGLVGESDPHSQANDPSTDDDERSWRDVSDRHRSRTRRWCDGEDHWRKRCTIFSSHYQTASSMVLEGKRVNSVRRRWVNGYRGRQNCG